ncbi:MAG: DUF3298 domain-containing protein [Deltaproteobacteria bacterium]|nr:DUF3298 domain-containing protein [Deltaproteobacteria bacterium]
MKRVALTFILGTVILSVSAGCLAVQVPRNIHPVVRSGILEERDCDHIMVIRFPVFSDPELDRLAFWPLKGFVEDFRAVSRLGHDLEPGPINNLDVWYSVYWGSPRLVTVVYEIESYAGGAHPSHDLLSVTIDCLRKERIRLADLGLDDPKSLERMGASASKKLSRELGDMLEPSMLYRVTEPREDNFRLVAPMSDGVYIFFSRGTVAPYVEGQKRIFIPWSELNGTPAYITKAAGR